MQGRMISLSWIPQRDILAGWDSCFTLFCMSSYLSTHICVLSFWSSRKAGCWIPDCEQTSQGGFAQKQAHTEALDAIFAVKSIKCFYQIYQTPVTLIVSILFVLLSQSQCYIFCCGSETSTLYWSSRLFEYIYDKYST